ncbi:GNAT family N-acetyltransferase [Microbacterium sp. AK031]|uniref:GNAT family N-acetyltransferase n=1 Tax=Microbacterium sp. AK031 TaxID=2723076 RepID=UPI00216A5E98|nr:GNAT family N-acetyltransferase [Microbacterium sp. AK031]MCS3842166.1 putative acetyltransferase [Microbacterium sp. AK031]
MTDARSIPVDPTSAERLAGQQLTYRTIDMSSPADAEAFFRADARGFLDAEPTAEAVSTTIAALEARRNLGVFEAGADTGTLPVATVNSWITPLTVPGGEVDMWAISSVTVSGTHRRRGIARALLEGELRAAASAGVPVAGLTASEATIYGRYGFASAIPVARITIDTHRAGWAASAPVGRIEYVDKETLRDHLSALHEVERAQRSGQIAGWKLRWERVAGLTPDHPSAAAVRGVRYLDEHGSVRGVMAYKLAEIPDAFRFEMTVFHLSAVTSDALTALWGFALQHDLVDKVSVDLRPIDEPLPWLVADRRGVEVAVHDHGWLRILDVPTALSSRTYRAPIELVFRVVDTLGFADGSWRLAVDGGRGTVTPEPDATADVRLDVATLSALYVGGVSAVQLRAAGLLDATAEVAASIDDAFRAAAAPLLGIWY